MVDNLRTGGIPEIVSEEAGWYVKEICGFVS